MENLNNNALSLNYDTSTSIKNIASILNSQLLEFLNSFNLKLNILSFQLNTIENKVGSINGSLNKKEMVQFQTLFNKLPHYIYKVNKMVAIIQKINTLVPLLKIRQKKVIENYQKIQVLRRSQEERMNSKIKVKQSSLSIHTLKTRTHRNVLLSREEALTETKEKLTETEKSILKQDKKVESQVLNEKKRI
ncbi:hypothetical protein K502DRAFT_367632 [Neoconidiobolus thromboides FSU 785]|nr:hypothetical protein K502DRAFT_367632 [Neoconidiobolus thromboides FSU 785]